MAPTSVIQFDDSDDSSEPGVCREGFYNQYGSQAHNPDEPVAGPSGIVRPSTSKESRVDEPVAGPSEIVVRSTSMASREIPKKRNTRENMLAERELKKQKAAEEQAAKKRAEEINKIYKPAECMKYMNVEGHPALWSSWWCADVSREVSATGAKVVSTSDLIDPALVVWSRNVPRTIDKERGQLQLTKAKEPCKRAIYISTVKDIAEHVINKTLGSHLKEVKLLCDCDLTLVLLGVKDYFNPKGRKTSSSIGPPMTQANLELAVTDLLISSECDTVIAETPNELALLIVQFTKAIAEAPFKKKKRALEEAANFYTKGDNKNCVVVDKNGVAASKLWQQMLAILPHSSLETSRALCANYKTPLALFQALGSPNNVKKVADIGVSRAAVPGSKSRRIGPELARKLNILFTAQDGNTLVD